MVSTLFRDPQALSSDLASLGTLQPRAFGSLNRVETLDSASNYYICNSCRCHTSSLPFATGGMTLCVKNPNLVLVVMGTRTTAVTCTLCFVEWNYSLFIAYSQ